MNILYGVQGTGNGHISRSREVIRCLRERGHHVEVIISGRDPDSLWDLEDFEPYLVYQGLTFITHKGKIDYAKTALQLNLPQFFYDIHAHNINNLDLVITDFEPISARIAKKHKLPSIGIGHQYAFWHDIPVANSNFLAHYIMKNYAPVDVPIGLHWHHFNQPILPPIIPTILDQTVKQDPCKILVYLPFENLSDIIHLVQSYETHDFYIYHALSKTDDIGNLHLRSFSRHGFLSDLQNCSGVICGAGFELISEALKIGKKILVKPLTGQMEQHSNALALEDLELGMVMKTLNKKSLEGFLNSHEFKKLDYPDVAHHIVQWLEKGQLDNIDGLVESCWDRVF